MRKDEQESFLGYLLFFVLYILILFAILRIVFKIAKWAAPGFWNCMVKPKPAAYDMVRGMAGVVLVYGIAVYVRPEMLNSISIGFAAAVLSFIAAKFAGYRIWTRKKRKLQVEYAAMDGQGVRIVEISRLPGSVSNAVRLELKQKGINRVVKEAQKVPWADRLVIASAAPGAGKRHAAKVAERERISPNVEFFPKERGRLL